MKIGTRLNLFLCKTLAIVLMLLPLPAFAQTAAESCPPGSICLATVGSSIRDFLLAAILAFGGALITVATGFIYRRWGITVSKDVHDRANKIIEDAAGLVVGRIEDMTKFEVRVGNPLIADAANWALGEIPGQLHKIGVTPAAERQWIEDRVTAAVGRLTGTEPNNPTVPNPTTLT